MLTTFVAARDFVARTCNGCGACCEGLTLDRSPLELVRAVAAGLVDERTAAWLRDLEPNEERSGFDGALTWRCTRYVDGRCSRYAERPEPCWTYPFQFVEDGGTVTVELAPVVRYARCSWHVGLIQHRVKG